MICGALQTLNEDAFEDVLSNDRNGGGGGVGGTSGETLNQQLAPIRESYELNSPSDNLSLSGTMQSQIYLNHHHNQNHHLHHESITINGGEEQANVPTVIVMPFMKNIDDTTL